jgi:hypothetical protein
VAAVTVVADTPAVAMEADMLGVVTVAATGIADR